MNIKKIFAAAIALVLLGLTFWWGGNAPGLRGTKKSSLVTPALSTAETAVPHETELPNQKASENMPANGGGDGLKGKNEETIKNTNAPEHSAVPGASKSQQGEHTEKNAGQKPEADTPEEKLEQAQKIAEEQGESIDHMFDSSDAPPPVSPSKSDITDKKMTCSLTVSCKAIFDNIDWFDKDKLSILPSDGIIYKGNDITFNEGESVFDVMLREMKKNKIHFEYTNSPVYKTAYIEGINNIYEFDCGSLSGWTYRVNGVFPNYGCSLYRLKNGDSIEFLYTCNLGVDVGGHN